LSQISLMILHFDGEFCINSLQWGDVFSVQVCIPHTESCAVQGRLLRHIHGS
jgi:hypothetical protein